MSALGDDAGDFDVKEYKINKAMYERIGSPDYLTAGPKTICMVCDHIRAVHVFRNNHYLCLRIVAHPTLGQIECNCTRFISGEMNIENISDQVA